MKVLKGLKSINDFLERPTLYITGFLLLLGIVFICIEVFGRYVLGESQAFLEEQSRYFLIWFVYLILAVVSRERAHIKIDTLSRLLKGKGIDIAEILFHLSVIVFCIVVGWGMIESIHAFYLTGQISTTQFALPEWSIRVVIPVGLFLLLLRNIELVMEGVIKLKTKQDVSLGLEE